MEDKRVLFVHPQWISKTGLYDRNHIMPNRQISVSERFRRSLSVYESGRVQRAIPIYVLPALFIMIYGIGHLTVSVDGISLVSTGHSLGILPRFLNAITDFVSLIVLLIFFRRPFVHVNWQYLPWMLLLASWVGLLIICGSIGIAGGTIDLISLSLGVRAYSRLFVPFLIGMFLLGEKDIKWMLKAILVTGFLQSLLASLQAFEDATPDMICGLMGLAGSGRLGSFQVMCVGILLAKFINYSKSQNAFKQMGRLIKLVAGTAILLFPLILAESKAAFLAMGLVTVAILRYRSFSYRGSVLYVGVFSILSLLGIGFSQIYNVNLLESFSPSAIYEALIFPDQGDVYGRLQIFSELNRLLTDSFDFFWGLGPGYFNDSIIVAYNETGGLANLKDKMMGSLSFGTLILLETGFLGVFLWCIFFFYLFKQMYRSRLRLSTLADGRYMFDAFVGFFIAICFTLVYNLGLLSPSLYFPFMLFSGYVVRIADE